METVIPIAESQIELWPIHLKPKKDELLSSWLFRLTSGHGQKLHTFCDITWPRKAIWNRDIDRSADDEIVRTLSAKTYTPVTTVSATTLASYTGTLWENQKRYGPTPWILPVGIYHRIHRQFGLQYCSRCLAEDSEPYYRRKWRLAFMWVCEKHHILLRDRCPGCSAPVNFHRGSTRTSFKSTPPPLVLCHGCGSDLRRSVPNRRAELILLSETRYTCELLEIVASGVAQLNSGTTIYSQLFFAGLRQILKVLAMRNQKIAALRLTLSRKYAVRPYVPDLVRQRDIEEQDVGERRVLMTLARCLLDDWPQTFVDLAERHKIWSSIWLRHFDSGSRHGSRSTPFWLWQVVREHLYRPRYIPSHHEVASARQYLLNRNEPVNKSTLARLLGVATLRRS
jgi:hypothetical protein